MGLFEAHGYHVTHDSDHPQGDIAVINTCGFIEDAKQESIDTILEFVQAKEEARLQKLFVMGCLSERYLADLEKEIPEVDGWYGKFNYKQLLKDLEVSGERLEVRDYHRHVTTPKHYAYLKIAEDVTVIVPTALYLLLPVSTRVVRWTRYLTRCAIW